jgi:hypothetical protein
VSNQLSRTLTRSNAPSLSRCLSFFLFLSSPSFILSPSALYPPPSSSSSSVPRFLNLSLSLLLLLLIEGSEDPLRDYLHFSPDPCLGKLRKGDAPRARPPPSVSASLNPVPTRPREGINSPRPSLSPALFPPPSLVSTSGCSVGRVKRDLSSSVLQKSV